MKEYWFDEIKTFEYTYQWPYMFSEKSLKTEKLINFLNAFTYQEADVYKYRMQGRISSPRASEKKGH